MVKQKNRRADRLGAGGRRPGQRNQVRIIGGLHRGRRISFPDLPGLRPTADRNRETLFNWLQPMIAGAKCLDLFAGSGALGFEAASRGADEVVMLERSAKAVDALLKSCELLGCQQVQIIQTDALKWLDASSTREFDILFLDPPFTEALLSDCCEKLAQGDWLATDARIYLEMDLDQELPEFPQNWRLSRKKQSGQVVFYLFIAEKG